MNRRQWIQALAIAFLFLAGVGIFIHKAMFPPTF